MANGDSECPPATVIDTTLTLATTCEHCSPRLRLAAAGSLWRLGGSAGAALLHLGHPHTLLHPSHPDPLPFLRHGLIKYHRIIDQILQINPCLTFCICSKKLQVLSKILLPIPDSRQEEVIDQINASNWAA